MRVPFSPNQHVWTFQSQGYLVNHPILEINMTNTPVRNFSKSISGYIEFDNVLLNANQCMRYEFEKKTKILKLSLFHSQDLKKR